VRRERFVTNGRLQRIAGLLSPSAWTGVRTRCDEAHISHICCYNFHYETLNRDGGDPSFTFADAAQEFISTPTCAIPLTRDAGSSGQVPAVEDAGAGVCTIEPRL
jgi:hypothetical protein